MNNNINTQVYSQKVELLLRLIPIVVEEGVFAIHGGTAINLFLKDLPRSAHASCCANIEASKSR